MPYYDYYYYGLFMRSIHFQLTLRVYSLSRHRRDGHVSRMMPWRVSVPHAFIRRRLIGIVLEQGRVGEVGVAKGAEQLGGGLTRYRRGYIGAISPPLNRSGPCSAKAHKATLDEATAANHKTRPGSFQDALSMYICISTFIHTYMRTHVVQL